MSGATVLQVGTDQPRAGVEYSRIVDRGETAPAASVLVAVVEDFSGGTLRVSLETSPNGKEFTTFAEGGLHLADHLDKGRRLLEAEVPPGSAARFVRLRYQSTGEHKQGALFGGLVTSPAETLNTAIGPTKAKTYHELALEQQAQERAIAARKPGLDPGPVFRPGEVPRTGSVWDNVDRSIEQPTAEEP
jgi:hypothetical protein